MGGGLGEVGWGYLGREGLELGVRGWGGLLYECEGEIELACC